VFSTAILSSSAASKPGTGRPRNADRAKAQIGERSKKTTLAPDRSARRWRAIWRVTIASMKSAFSCGEILPRACSRAMTSVAASSTTKCPAASSPLRIAVFPAPGCPVRMCRCRVLPSYLGRKRLLAGKPLGASRPAPARLPDQSRHSGKARVRPAASVQANPSAALKITASRRPPSR